MIKRNLYVIYRTYDNQIKSKLFEDVKVYKRKKKSLFITTKSGVNYCIKNYISYSLYREKGQKQHQIQLFDDKEYYIRKGRL